MKDIFSIQHRKNFSAELPKDSEENNFSRQVVGACFSDVETKVPGNPEMVHVSDSLLEELNLSIDDKKEFLQVMSGSKTFNGFKPYAMCYGGHQFGNWAGQLGDGRAINIAELDIENQNWKLQLKGSGPTPYSRGSDGLAVLRSSIREYLCSEAMYHLGVPSTRALSLVKTGDLVTRDILYDGNKKDELGAVVCRMSPSFIRFGSFELLAARNDSKILKQLVDYTITNHYPDLGKPSKDVYIQFFKTVAKKTREMILHWQRVGFVHGVMNTDNMSILGLTIDYGPYGWLENYDRGWTPNTTDKSHRRYRFGNQAQISLWNLSKLANALYPLVLEVEPFQEVLKNYGKEFLTEFHEMKLSKLGLYNVEIPETFLNDLEDLMEKDEVDMTLFYRYISSSTYLESWDIFKTSLEMSSYKPNDISGSDWKKWFKEYTLHLAGENISSAERSKNMKLVNPKYVLRNYMAQLAIESAETGDNTLVDELYQLLLKPYDEQPEMEKWFSKRPDWAKSKVGCSMLSCSS